MKDNEELLAIADGIMSFCTNITKVGCVEAHILDALVAAMDNHRATEIQSKIRDLTPVEQSLMYKAIKGRKRPKVEKVATVVKAENNVKEILDGMAEEKKPRGRPRKASTMP